MIDKVKYSITLKQYTMCLATKEKEIIPREMMTDVHWVFQGMYDDRSIFRFQAADYMRDVDIFKYAKWRPDLVPLKEIRKVKVCLNDNDEYEELEAFEDDGFSNVDILFALHNKFSPALKGSGKYFFRGLKLKSFDGETPCFSCMVQ